MMRRSLISHPTTSLAGATVSLDVRRTGDGQVLFWFSASGMSGVRLSHDGRPPTRDRLDELWRHTCCEAFIKAGTGYYEFNFAPGGDWQAYHFTGYREGMSRPDLPTPIVSAHRHGDLWQLQAYVDPGGLPGLQDGAPLVMGASAVIETKAGDISYWALAHPSDKPDFHHPDSFVLELP
ncbi:MAG: DOMON-like domain-containing protein [Brevundimonas sp.]|nr:DOMON-like domain-containing protein [Brevundimonas sp.]